MSQRQVRVSGTGVLLVSAVSALGAVLLGIYFTPLLLFGFAGVGFFPVNASNISPDMQQGDLQITHLVPASEVHVGDVLMLWDSTTNTHFSHHVVTAQELFDGVRFVTAGVGGLPPDSTSFIAERSDAIPVVLWTVPLWGEVITVIYSPQFQALFVFILGVVVLIAVMRRFRSHRPGLNSEAWNDD